ncbi:MAG: cysteine desulfurase [Acidobacteriota bacterium]
MTVQTPAQSSTRSAAPALDVESIRRDFPALHQEVHGHPLVYLDNAASAHKPRPVLDAVEVAYSRHYSNVHRGVHTLSQRATDAYEAARERVRSFLGAARAEDCIFVRGATEAINLVAYSFVLPRLEPGDEVLVSQMEHHSNIVPWQLVCAQAGAELKVVPIDDRGELDLDAYRDLLGPRVKMVSLVHVSNALGTVNPVRELCALARKRGVPTLLDGAQAAPHGAIDVQEIGCDFYTFSGHKVFGPTGIGVLWGRGELLAAMPPWQGGGEMITSVSFSGTEFHVPPHRFEAGTPHIVGAIGLGAALDYLDGVGLDAVAAHEAALLARATEALEALPWVRIVGTADHKAAVVSFVVEDKRRTEPAGATFGVHPHDIGTILDFEGVAIRAGHHCAQPVMERYGLPATARASFAFYNTFDEVDRLVHGLRRVAETFGLA